jgi:hypothetical protein
MQGGEWTSPREPTITVGDATCRWPEGAVLRMIYRWVGVVGGVSRELSLSHAEEWEEMEGGLRGEMTAPRKTARDPK